MTQIDMIAAAKRALVLVDLTNLNDDCSEADVTSLCERAQTEHGNTAAICIWPRFVAHSRTVLEGTDIRIATVVNFPDGGDDVLATVNETSEAIEDGADEIDLVLPYKAFLTGRAGFAETMILKTREAMNGKGRLKVILETGKMGDPGDIRAASDLAISAGADFIKTSTGKVSVNATLATAEIMLGAIRENGKPVGFKPAGGIKTTQDTADYLALADHILGAQWATAETFRFGASGVLDALVATIDGKTSGSGEGY